MAGAPSEAVTIRRARPEDAEGIARVQVDSWRSTYAALLPKHVLLRMTYARQGRLWRGYLRDPRAPVGAIYVAEAPRLGVIGFGSCGKEQTGKMAFAGEVYTLYVDDAWHNQGLGRRLLRTLFAHLARSGMNSAVIWVLEGNPARFFYENMGGVQAAQRRSQQWGVTITERGYGWSDVLTSI